MAGREIDVYVDIDGTPQPLGHAWFSQRRGGPVTTVFAYSPTYLSQPAALSIDPNLQLVTGNQYIDGLPGAFHDCAPDRWGRNLIEKRHRFRSSDQKVAKLNEVDFLVGVSDKTRQASAGGWTFAPIFDVNPNPDVLAARVTGIAGATARSEERELAKS